MGSKIAMLIALAIVFFVILLINNIKAHHIERAWFIAGAILVTTIAWIINFVRNSLRHSNRYCSQS